MKQHQIENISRTKQKSAAENYVFRNDKIFCSEMIIIADQIFLDKISVLFFCLGIDVSQLLWIVVCER
jgi:hypothetical protein